MATPKFVLEAMLRRTLIAPSATAMRTLSSVSGSARGILNTPMTASPRRLGSSSKPACIVGGSSSPYMSMATRWKHAGKIGHMKETLEEMAHRPEREAAQEKRKKKKERSASKRKGKKEAGGVEADTDEQEIMSSFDTEEEDWDEDYDLDDDLEEGGDEDEEPSLPDPSLVKDKMMKAVDRFQESLKSIRGAEPSPEMFDDIQVSAYGSMTPLKAVGQVVIVSATLAHITCFDPSVAKDVQKAVQLSLSLNPQMDEGGMVKVPLPRVSMEIREQTAKQLKKMAESCRQRIRKVRRKAMDVVKKGKDGKLAGVSKDDAFANAKEIEAATESVMENLKGAVDKKMESIMAV